MTDANDKNTMSDGVKKQSSGVEKLWGGRFTENTDTFVEAFTASVIFDQRMYAQDIEGSLAHATMLNRVGVLTDQDLQSIQNGLKEIAVEIENGELQWSVALEDVHMNIEARLTAKIGDAGKRLHTGRSRNDQVATDLRLYLRKAISEVENQLERLAHAYLEQARKHASTIMPGFTHLQSAQPVTVGHHIMAWFEMLLRDISRLRDCRSRMNYSPLGAAALAGTSYPIDREFTAAQLGFSGVCENSLDAVSDRDFAIEFCAFASILLMHYSRIAEELVLWSSAQFDFISLPDRFCTGSSIMPQKKNPDVAELVRGKSGRTYGQLIALLTLMKGQPLTYNKDNQEDKEPLFDSVDTVISCSRAFADMIPNIEFKQDKLRAAAGKGFSTATDLADYLVRAGLAFRDAHEVVGKVVQVATQRGIDLSEFELSELRQFTDKIEEDVFSVLTLDGSVQSRNHIGGTAPEQVNAAIARGHQRLQSLFST